MRWGRTRGSSVGTQQNVARHYWTCRFVCLVKLTKTQTRLAGFNYDIHALEADEHASPDELIEAFDRLCSLQTGISVSRIMRQQFPILRHIVRTDTNRRRKSDIVYLSPPR